MCILVTGRWGNLGSLKKGGLMFRRVSRLLWQRRRPGRARGFKERGMLLMLPKGRLGRYRKLGCRGRELWMQLWMQLCERFWKGRAGVCGMGFLRWAE